MFTDLLSALTELKLQPESSSALRRFYKTLTHVFQLFLMEKTSVVRLNFAGTFAKTDYLIKEHAVPKPLALAINDTRVRFRKSGAMTDDELRQFHLVDLRNLCLFISHISHVEVPGQLTEVFPRDVHTSHRSTELAASLRMIVTSWDTHYIYGTCEGLEEEQQVAFGEWGYLQKMLRQRSQLNLVNPRLSEGTIHPELIILEPDYLVDISTIAHCFTNYAESPFVALLSKLSPAQNTEAILLGNFAGQLLDEQIHQQPDGHSYMQSLTDFWRDNALSLLTAGVGPEFHTEAQRQQQNIAHAIDQALPSAVAHFDSREGIVEPSFFSPMLGLQGRMDYLQLDFKVLLEQKSGKAEFPYDAFRTPRLKEEHYVQLLLYMSLIRYNYREVYEHNNQELQAFLLYSKYTESLLGIGFAPGLLFRALKVRNGIACADLMYAQEDGFRLLSSLTPDKLNLKHVSNPLWKNHQYTQIAQLLAPVQSASPLEREYYYRFLTFIANEHVLSKLGNKTKDNSGFASTWLDSLDEKLEAGNIYDRLTLLSPDEHTQGHIHTIRLQFTERDENDMSNFRIGDAVILYSYLHGTEPDACHSMVFRCSIDDVDSDTITLILRFAQSDSRVFIKDKDCLWAIEHDFFESSYSNLYRGMHAFLSAPRERRDLLLFQREAEVEKGRAIKGEYGAFNLLSSRVKAAKDLFLIIGPPGTGKTSFGMLNTLKEELLEPDSSVLLLSFTNRAVDEICSKLLEEDIDFIRLGGEQTCAPEYRHKLLSSRISKCTKLSQLEQLIRSTRVFVANTTKMNSTLSLFQLKTFTLAIIDEASQILEPQLIGLLSAHNAGIPAIRKFVMIGDHKQLPAVVQQTPEVSRVDNPLLNSIHLTDCRLSLFERLLRKYGSSPDHCYMLTRQGRMHRDIAEFSNIAFYDGRLDVVPLPHQIAPLPPNSSLFPLHSINHKPSSINSHRILFIDSPLPLHSPSDKVNQIEADIIADLVINIYEKEHSLHDIGIIVPYRNQIATIRNTISTRLSSINHKPSTLNPQPSTLNLTIDTVERFQGSQRKYIIYGFTIQKRYQLQFLTSNVFIDESGNRVDRKLNVALTRAKEHLILVGNTSLLYLDPTFRRLIEFVKEKGGWIS